MAESSGRAINPVSAMVKFHVNEISVDSEIETENDN